MGCKRRSPGRKGGLAPGMDGRCRWNIGWPGTGRPGAERCPIGCPGCTVARGCTGAKYTGRGPVCGVITRRGGGTAAAGLCAVGGADAAGAEVTGGRGTFATTGGATGAAACGGGAGVAGGTGGRSADGLSITGATNFGAGAGAGCSTGAGTTAVTGLAATGTTGLGGTGGAGFATGGGTEISVVAFLLMAFSTSPGLEILERSILVLISSATPPLDLDFSAAAFSTSPWKCLRTRST